MRSADVVPTVVLLVVNLITAFSFGIPLAKKVRRASGRMGGILRYLALLVTVYFIECIAFAAGMGTQVFSVGLAFVWGVTFGLWFREPVSMQDFLRTTLLLSLYTCIPTVSFSVVLPIMCVLGGRSILSVEEGIGFGLPDLLPWPLNTILGFCAVLAIGTVLLKTVITTGEVSVLNHLRKRRVGGTHRENEGGA